MKSLKCPSCGAPIEIDEEAVVQVCTHCGSNLAPTRHLAFGGETGPRGTVHRIDLSGGRRLSPLKSFGCIVAVLLLILGFGGFVAWKSFSMQGSIGRSIESVTRGLEELPGKKRDSKAPLAVAALAEPSFRGRHEIAAAPPPGGLAAFEPVAGLPWALALAQVWSSDAKLERIDVERLRPDGTVNVADDPEAEVTYRFVSPRRFTALRERANLESNPRGDQEFWIELEQGRILAYELETHAAFASDREAAEIEALAWPKSLPLPALLRGIAGKPQFPDVPFYKGYLIRLEREGWCWYLSTLSGSPSIPRVRARDGRMWPY